jgi:inner membrane protein
MQDSVGQITASLRNSQMFRLFSVAFLALLLQIPISMIGGLVSERQERRQQAVGEVSSKWGGTQILTGPALVVPYTHRWAETSAAAKPIARIETRHAVFLPEQLRVRGSMESENRSRGIFTVPVYGLDLRIEGEFARPSLAELNIDPASILWERTHLAIGISDARAIQEETAVTWPSQTRARASMRWSASRAERRDSPSPSRSL